MTTALTSPKATVRRAVALCLCVVALVSGVASYLFFVRLDENARGVVAEANRGLWASPNNHIETRLFPNRYRALLKKYSQSSPRIRFDGQRWLVITNAGDLGNQLALASFASRGEVAIWYGPQPLTITNATLRSADVRIEYTGKDRHPSSFTIPWANGDPPVGVLP